MKTESNIVGQDPNDGRLGFEDLTGARFERLTVLGLHGMRGRKRYWECQCDCGKVRFVEGSALNRGRSLSCGCIRKDRAYRTHGMHDTRQYHIWENMKARCSNEKCMYYKFYGGRGIQVCERWLTFAAFWEDMRDGYADHLTIDRKDCNGDYEPGNCRWATIDEQKANVRSNIWLAFRGERKTRAQWAKALGFRPGMILKRIRAGWSVDEALSTPPLRSGEKRSARPVSRSGAR